MSKSTTDRNLLFGILALQMDFIRRDALIAAMNAWVLDKTRPLGQILCDQLALTADNRAWLEAGVERHLAQHSNDAQKSLASVSSVGSLRDDLKRIVDPDLQASLVRLPSLPVLRERGAGGEGAEPADDPYATVGAVGQPTSKGERFRIVRPHAEGGLGKVYVAHDEELHREVALKEIKGHHADDPESRSRFLLEAEITGGLEHPGIVPVYGLGQYADGRPFYAMRFIKGDSLKDAIERYHNPPPSPPVFRGRGAGGEGVVARNDADRNLELRKLLGRFIDVCQAMQYAHDRGVLHRDLKPANIMLGKYGETLVVDWGLAKATGAAPRTELPVHATEVDEPALRPASGSGSAETLPGSAFGTPQFMSPEQAAGRLDQLGPASDVYSLGATLFTLLTGRSSVEEKDVATALQKVQKGDISRPRTVKPDVDPALDAICTKAMALKQADRYKSPRSLADDIEHWLADEPVGAHAEPFSIRARRWTRKHRTLATSVAAVLLVATIGSMVASVLLAQANDNLDSANRGLKATNEQLDVARKDAEARRQQAEEEKQIAQSVRAFLQRDLLLQADASHQADRLLELGVTSFKTVDDPTVKELLDRAAAELAPDKIELKFPKQPRVQAEILQTVGNTYRSVGDFAKAVGHLERARKLYSTTLSPDHSETLSSMNNLAVGYQDAGKLDLALPLYEETLKLRKSKLGPDDPATLVSMNNLAAGYQEADKLALALPLYEETLKRRRATLGADHSDTLVSMNNLAHAHRNQGKLDLALPLYKETLKRRQAKLGRDHPATLFSMNNLAVCYQADRKLDLAVPLYEETLKLRKAKLGLDHPDTLTSMNNLASGYHAQGKFDLAVPLFEETLRLTKAKLPAEHPDTLNSMHNLRKAYLAAKEPAKALALVDAYVAVQRKRLGAEDPRFAGELAMISLDLLNVRQFAEAEVLLRECLAIRAKAAPDGWTTFNTKAQLGGALLGQKKYADAESLLLEGYKGMKKREAKIPAVGKQRLTEAEGRLAEFFEATRQKVETKLQGKLTASTPAAVHEIKLTAGRPVVIEMHSREFDAYLRLQDAKGVSLAENDDIDFEQRNLSARIVFFPKMDGVYRLAATSPEQSGVGAYTITVREYAGTKK